MSYEPSKKVLKTWEATQLSQSICAGCSKNTMECCCFRSKRQKLSTNSGEVHPKTHTPTEQYYFDKVPEDALIAELLNELEMPLNYMLQHLTAAEVDRFFLCMNV
jgi:hypothetical protein